MGACQSAIDSHLLVTLWVRTFSYLMHVMEAQHDARLGGDRVLRIGHAALSHIALHSYPPPRHDHIPKSILGL